MFIFINIKKESQGYLITLFLLSFSFLLYSPVRADICSTSNYELLEEKFYQERKQGSENKKRSDTELAKRFYKFRSFAVNIIVDDSESKTTGVASYLGNGWFISAQHVFRSMKYTNVFLDDYKVEDIVTRNEHPHLKYFEYPVIANNGEVLQNQDNSFVLQANGSLLKDNVRVELSGQSIDLDNRYKSISVEVEVHAPNPIHISLKEYSDHAWSRAIVNWPDVVLFKVKSNDMAKPKVASFLNSRNTIALAFKKLEKNTKIEGIYQSQDSYVAYRFSESSDSGLAFYSDLPRGGKACEKRAALFPELSGISEVAIGSVSSPGTSGSPAFISANGQPAIVGITSSAGWLEYEQSHVFTDEQGKEFKSRTIDYTTFVDLNHPYIKSWIKSHLSPSNWYEL